MSGEYRYIAWTDIETTGLDIDDGDMLEVGIVLTDLDLKTLAKKTWLVRPPALDLLTMPPVVREMHNKSGLLVAIFDAVDNELKKKLADPEYGRYPQGCDFKGPQHVQHDICSWIRERLPLGDDEKLALGGSGVSHFDVNWLEVYMPRFADMCHRSTLDVGVIRRFIENVCNKPKLVPKQTRDLPHRGLADAELHLREARRYRDLIGRI